MTKLNDEELAEFRILHREGDTLPEDVAHATISQLLANIDALTAERDRLRAEVAVLRAGAPDGWKTVPRKWTPQMEDRIGHNLCADGYDPEFIIANRQFAMDVWSEAYAAAPHPHAHLHATIVDGCLVHDDSPLSTEGCEAVSALIKAVREKHATAEQPPVQPVAVEVKPLVWENQYDALYGGTAHVVCRAPSMDHLLYEIIENSDPQQSPYTMWFNQAEGVAAYSLEEAKSIARDDHERRILSALEPMQAPAAEQPNHSHAARLARLLSILHRLKWQKSEAGMLSPAGPPDVLNDLGLFMLMDALDAVLAAKADRLENEGK